MSFSKLVWILQRKRLWFSSANYLEDKWELMPLGQQLNSIINSRTSSKSADEVTKETASTVKFLRDNTYVNCWTASEHESHALWRIYCPTPEGVAIQTTLGRLKKSVGLPVVEVDYDPHDGLGPPPEPIKLVTQKRPMFAYEKEVRIVHFGNYSDPKATDRKTLGVEVDWDPEIHVETIWVHPEAGFWFMETVTQLVADLAPKLSHDGIPLVAWSKMNAGLPF